MIDRRALLASGTAALVSTSLAGRRAHAQTRPKSVLKFVPSANLTVLDPIFSGAYVSLCHGYAVFDALFGSDASQGVQPQMAEKHSVSDEGLTWTIRLRDGLRFHDGEPVRAVDCVASLKRWTARQAAGQIVGGFVDGWAAPDDRTIRIALKRPMPTLATIMATSVFPPFIMPERLASIDPTKPVTEMIGSGPFRFKADEYVSGNRVVYERFENYVPRAEPAVWTAGGKIAKVDRIEWHIIPDAATAVASLRRGEIDWLERPIADLLPTLKADKNVKLGVIDPTGWTGFVRFNQTQAPFDNQGVRQAVMAAINQEDFLRVATGDDPDSYTVCKSMFPCGTMFGSQAGAAAMPGDIAAAKALLQQSGYAGETAVLLGATDNPPLGDFAELVADAMRKIGIKVDLVTTDWGTVTQRRAKREPVSQGGWSAFVSNVNGPAIMNPAVDFLVRGQGQGGYFGWYENAEVETLTRAWLEAEDQAERKRIADQIQTIAFKTVPEIPLGQYVQRTAYRSDVTGILQGPAVLPWNVAKA
ncbi:MAG: ABC transporter substrate-binding protein [Janthinobacterium lividum]